MSEFFLYILKILFNYRGKNSNLKKNSWKNYQLNDCTHLEHLRGSLIATLSTKK